MTWSVSPECRRRSKHTEIAPERSSFTTMLRHGLLSDKVYRICNGSFNILSLVLALRTNLINSPAPARLRPLTLSSMKILKARDFSLYDLAFSLSTPDRKYVSSATPFAPVDDREEVVGLEDEGEQGVLSLLQVRCSNPFGLASSSHWSRRSACRSTSGAL